MRTAIYWWAFNPPHLAHAEIAKEILAQNLADRIILIPSGRRRDKISYPVTDEQRIAMMRLFIEDIGDSRVSLDDSFLSKEPIFGSTVALHDYYIKHHWITPVQVFWSDTVAHMPGWFEPERVAQEVPKIIIRRAWDMTSMEKISNYREMQLNFHQNIAHLSSTLVRDGIKNGNMTWLSHRVAEYIKENNLYL